MRKQGDWSEEPTQLYPDIRLGLKLLEESFDEEGGRTVLEAPDSLAARAYASVAAPDRGAPRAQLPLPPSLRQTLSVGHAAPLRVPRLPTPAHQPTRGTNPERRLTLTPLPNVNPAPIVTPPPLNPITRPVPLAPRLAARPGTEEPYRYLCLVALMGLAIGMGLFHLIRAFL